MPLWLFSCQPSLALSGLPRHACLEGRPWLSSPFFSYLALLPIFICRSVPWQHLPLTGEIPKPFSSFSSISLIVKTLQYTRFCFGGSSHFSSTCTYSTS